MIMPKMPQQSMPAREKLNFIVCIKSFDHQNATLAKFQSFKKLVFSQNKFGEISIILLLQEQSIVAGMSSDRISLPCLAIYKMTYAHPASRSKTIFWDF